MFSSLSGSSATPINIRGRVRARRCAATLAAAALLAGVAGSASAAPVTSGGPTVAKVAVQTSIQMSGLTSDFTLSGAAGASVTKEDAVAMTVLTNNQAGYNVTVLAAANTLAPTAAGNTDSIPIAKLGVRKGHTGSFSPLSNVTAVPVHSQSTKSAAGGDTIKNDYTIDIPFVNGDTYTVTLNYIATTL